MPTGRQPRSHNSIELIEAVPATVANNNQYYDQVNRRRNNNQGIIENPLVHLTDEELRKDVTSFHRTCLEPVVALDDLLRAARVAQNVRSYDEVARSKAPKAGHTLPVQLTEKEKAALKAEKDVLFSERNMFIVILTVSLAAFLQGFVQSSINGASLYANEFGLPNAISGLNSTARHGNTQPQLDDWKLGATNASPFFFAALLGCWLSLPINDLVGRRGAMAVAACLIFASSLGAAWCSSWQALLLVRMVNGVGMGVKAVSTPILASETAVGFWRGSSILAWQLWVSFGIMMGFAFNLAFYKASSRRLSLQLILGAPFVPSIFLMIGLCFCPESPRYYMRRGTSSYNPQKAYKVLRRLRRTELQALRDLYLVYKSVELEEYSNVDVESESDGVPHGLFAYIKNYVSQYKQLFVERRLRNALISSSIVALSQQLCGINVLAFYSDPLAAMIYSLGYGMLSSNPSLQPLSYHHITIGAINFVFGLPAIRTIDTLGRRKWLVLTLPVMCLLMMAAALSSLHHDQTTRAALIAGCAFAIAINLLFAGLIQMFFPSIYAGLHDGGSLGLFAGLNFLALVLVFLFVEETKRRSLEDLDLIFAVKKRDFVRHQVTKYLPWFFRHYFLGYRKEKPSLYVDLIWNGPRIHSGMGGTTVNNIESWNGFDSDIGVENRSRLGGDDNISPSFPRRPSALTVLDSTVRMSEDSNDSAHR
ncbi:hypothetical protein M434DRAFT_79571 [Hypoxylon sp. CO27-5]|nr:hypothetical protein M434DRAFT_79571 [Hypoxylon sp. CO27-5]